MVDINEVAELDSVTREMVEAWWHADHERLHGAEVISRAEADGKYRRNFAFTAEADGEVIGIATGKCQLGLGYLRELIVDEAHRGKGVGSALLRQAENFCRHNEALRLALRTDATSVAVGFYIHHGWIIELESRNWIGGHSYLQMRKDLEGSADYRLTDNAS